MYIQNKIKKLYFPKIMVRTKLKNHTFHRKLYLFEINYLKKAFKSSCMKP